MAGIGKKATDKDYLEQWQKYCDNFRNATPTDLNETQADKFRRISRLENNPEEWFKYYFPHYCTAKPAAFRPKRARPRAHWNLTQYYKGLALNMCANGGDICQ